MGFLDTLHMISGQGVVATLVCLMVLPWIVFKILQQKSPKMTRLPPGPPSLPIIGNLHMLGSLPHRALRDLSQKYGPLMIMRLGRVPTLVASSPDMAEQILKTHDRVFSSRPATRAAKTLLYNSRDVAFAPYGPYWRQMRKVCTVHLLSAKRVESFRSVREEAVSHMIHSVLQTIRKGSVPVNISQTVSSLTNDIVCTITFGRKYTTEGLGREEFRMAIKDFIILSGSFDVGDFIPWIEWMDLQGLNRRYEKTHKTLDAFIEAIIKEHESQRHRQRDLVDILLAISEDNDLEMELTRDNIKAIMLEMLLAGTDTSSTVIEWAMSALLKDPAAMKKAQEELDNVIGVSRMVEEADLRRLEYLRSVVKETLRLYPPVPLLVPRESMETCTVSGYEIPAKTRVIVNAWAIGRDPKAWEDAETFRPERFIGSSIDVKGHNFELIPFGSGKRQCPGIQMGIVVAELALAQLLHCFHWRLPDGMNPCDLDMSEEFGITTPRAVHLLAVPTPRLKL